MKKYSSTRIALLPLALALVLSACQKEEAPPAEPNTLIKQEAPQKQTGQEGIQSKTFGNGATLALTRVQVSGKILIVEFIATPKAKVGGGYERFNTALLELKHFDYIVDATTEKVNLLQDNTGSYMANPNSGGKTLPLAGDNPINITLKFPAPAENVKTISIDVPEVGSFDAVPVSR